MVSRKIKKPSSKVKKYRRSVKFRRIQKGGEKISFTADKLPQKYADRYLEWLMQAHWKSRDFTFDTDTKILTWSSSKGDHNELNLTDNDEGMWNVILDDWGTLYNNILLIRQDKIIKLALRFKNQKDANKVGQNIIQYLPNYQEEIVRQITEQRDQDEMTREEANRQAHDEERINRRDRISKLPGGSSKKHKSHKKPKSHKKRKSRSRKKHRKNP